MRNTGKHHHRPRLRPQDRSGRGAQGRGRPVLRQPKRRPHAGKGTGGKRAEDLKGGSASRTDRGNGVHPKSGNAEFGKDPHPFIEGTASNEFGVYYYGSYLGTGMSQH